MSSRPSRTTSRWHILARRLNASAAAVAVECSCDRKTIRDAAAADAGVASVDWRCSASAAAAVAVEVFEPFASERAPRLPGWFDKRCCC